jgi:hypothetical protein
LPRTAQREPLFIAAVNASIVVCELAVTARRTARNKRFMMRQCANICKLIPGDPVKQRSAIKNKNGFANERFNPNGAARRGLRTSREAVESEELAALLSADASGNSVGN